MQTPEWETQPLRCLFTAPLVLLASSVVTILYIAVALFMWGGYWSNPTEKFLFVLTQATWITLPGPLNLIFALILLFGFRLPDQRARRITKILISIAFGLSLLTLAFWGITACWFIGQWIDLSKETVLIMVIPHLLNVIGLCSAFLISRKANV